MARTQTAEAVKTMPEFAQPAGGALVTNSTAERLHAKAVEIKDRELKREALGTFAHAIDFILSYERPLGLDVKSVAALPPDECAELFKYIYAQKKRITFLSRTVFVISGILGGALGAIFGGNILGSLVLALLVVLFLTVSFVWYIELSGGYTNFEKVYDEVGRLFGDSAEAARYAVATNLQCKSKYGEYYFIDKLVPDK